MIIKICRKIFHKTNKEVRTPLSSDELKHFIENSLDYDVIKIFREGE